MEKRIKTLGDLKDFVNILNENQLKLPAVLQGLDEMGRYICGGVITEEPEVLTEEGWCSQSDYDSCNEPGEENEEILDTRLPGYVYLFNEDFYED